MNSQASHNSFKEGLHYFRDKRIGTIEATVWVREDGAVCFAGENVVIKIADDGVLDVKIDFSCPVWVTAIILERLEATAEKGVRVAYDSEFLERQLRTIKLDKKNGGTAMTNPSEQTNETAKVVLKALTSLSLGEGATAELTDKGRLNFVMAALTMAFLLAKRQPELCDAYRQLWSLSHKKDKDAEVMLDEWLDAYATAEIIEVLKGLLFLSCGEKGTVKLTTIKLTDEERRPLVITALMLAFLIAKRRPELCDACGRYWNLNHKKDTHNKDAEVMLDEWLDAYAREKLEKKK